MSARITLGRLSVLFSTRIQWCCGNYLERGTVANYRLGPFVFTVWERA